MVHQMQQDEAKNCYEFSAQVPLRVHSLGPGSLISSWLDMAAHTVILAALCTFSMKMYGSSKAKYTHILHANYSMHLEIYNIRKLHTVQYVFFMFSHTVNSNLGCQSHANLTARFSE